MDYKLFHFLRNFAILLGATFLLFSIYPFMQYHKTSDWPTASATITQSELREGEPLFLGLGKIYHADISFVYQVAGKTINGNRVQYGIGGKIYIFKRFAQGMVDRYPVGKSTKVYYNPENPNDEIIESAPVLGFSFIWILLTVMFFSIAVFLTVRKNVATIDQKHKRYSLRPTEGEEHGEFVDFYPAQIYNPQQTGDRPIREPADQQTLHKRGDIDPERAAVIHEFDGDYPAQIYHPGSATDDKQKTVIKQIEMRVPIIGWRMTITIDK
ncbi:MAG: DUF3592 domain-containing protein [Magnetococcales bacterium]|nr:DUF3592 domain-containing protein [Magnetococcales bacterium]